MVSGEKGVVKLPFFALSCSSFILADVVAAENCGMRMVCCGHYDTEVFGVRAVASAMRRALKVKAIDLTEELR